MKLDPEAPWSVIDTETGHQGEFRVGVMLDESGRVQASRDIETFRAMVTARPGRVVWGHNVSYDIGVLWGGAVGCRFMRGHFRSASFQGVHFLDTMSFFECKLDEAAKMCGGHGKSGDGAASRDYTLDVLTDYCADDCRETAHVVRKIQAVAKRFDVSPIATGPGNWARAVLEQCEPWTREYPDDYTFVRKGLTPQDAIRGGLVKYQMGELRDGEKWDIKSAYPWQMWAGEFPHLPSCTIGRKSGGRVALIEFDLNGEWVWGPPEEMEEYGITRHRRVARCPNGNWGRPFRRFVEHTMQIRGEFIAAGDKGGNYLAKRIANSLSGALGARTLSTFVKHGVVTGGQRREFGLPGTRSLWCALVTGRQRARVLRAWKVAAVPAYSDTDSLVCKKYTPDGEGSELFGRWELETAFDRAVILGPKMYATWKGDESTGHVKGIPKRLAVPTVERLMKGGETVVEWDSVVTYREMPTAKELWTKRRRDPFRGLRQNAFSSKVLPNLED